MKSLTYLLMSLLISSCGFHLRGTIDWPSEIKSLSVTGEQPYGELVVQLQTLLGNMDVKVSDDAAFELFITEEEQEKQRISVSKSAFFDEFQLISRAEFELRDRSGQSLTAPMTASVQSVFRDDASNPASKANEENLLRSELNKALALQIIRQVAKIDPQHLQTVSTPSTDKPR